VSKADEFLRNNRQFAAGFDRLGFPIAQPAMKVVVVTCMDARLDPARALGIEPGDAHVLRNAGGVVTDDVIRSLAVSQRLLGTEEIVLVHHTDCGMARYTDEEVQAHLEAETGTRAPFPLEFFADVDASVRESIARIKASPFVAHTDAIRGFVYDVSTGKLREVDAQ
jgi:carbonic anhydrase